MKHVWVVILKHREGDSIVCALKGDLTMDEVREELTPLHEWTVAEKWEISPDICEPTLTIRFDTSEDD